MKNTRTTFWFIIILTVLAVLIDLPRLPLQFKVGPLVVNRVIGGGIDTNIFGQTIKNDFPIKLGLDLSGGIDMVLRANMTNIDPKDRDAALESVKNVIEKRVNAFGVAEPLIQTSKTGGDYRLIVELPQVTDASEAAKLIGTTAQLDFRLINLEATRSATRSADLFIPTGVTGKDLKRSQVDFDRNTGKPQVALEFSDEGTKKFADITKNNVGKQLAIFLDDQLLINPEIKEPILNGRSVINGEFTPDFAKTLAIQLNAGALPVSIERLSESVISATLGTDSIRRSIVAGLIGLSIVAVFMLVNYGFLGLLADIVLIIYTLLVLAIFKTGLFILPPITLTLAGIAGFILSIGMAVDANILIFERMREEIRWGRNRKVALALGFARAWNSIRDSNISSLLTCSVLYWFGTGMIRGFALTLAIGILVSMFTAITVMRTFLRLRFKDQQ